MKENALALVVMPSSADRDAVWSQLKALRVEVLTVSNCRQARRLLRTGLAIDMVITDVSLVDGNWCDVLREVVDSDSEANVIVNTPSPNAILWSEVLWRGVYDLVSAPYQDQELRYVIEGALRSARPGASCGERPVMACAR